MCRHRPPRGRCRCPRPRSPVPRCAPPRSTFRRRAGEGWRGPSRCSTRPCSRPRRERVPSYRRRPWCGRRRAPAAARGRGPVLPRTRCPDRADGRRCATCASVLPRRAPCGARSCRRRWSCRPRFRARRSSGCGAHPSRPTRSTDPTALPRAPRPSDRPDHRRRAPSTRRRRWSSRCRRRPPRRSRSGDLRKLRPPPQGGCPPDRCGDTGAAGRLRARPAVPRSRSRSRGSPLPGEASATLFSGPCSSSSPRFRRGRIPVDRGTTAGGPPRQCREASPGCPARRSDPHHRTRAFRLASEPDRSPPRTANGACDDHPSGLV